MRPSVTWSQALAWRMRRHQLDPVEAGRAADVVRRLCGVQAQVASSAELAIRLRLQHSEPGLVDEALTTGQLIKTWAMRGTLHLLTPDDGPALLSVIAAGRSWERPSWQRYFDATPQRMERLREVVREALDGTVMTREELVDVVSRHRELGHLADELRSGWGTLLKPLCWQGDIVFGPSRGNRVTFARPEATIPGWSGIPDPDEAAPIAIAAYLRAYAPATADAFGNWLAGGWFGTRRLRAWFAELGERVAEIEVDGERAYVLAEDLDDLASSRATDAVRLLAGFDQYVLGPGTSDPHVIPPGRRRAVSKQSGWIAPVVIAGGAVAGTWELADDAARVAWFGESGRPPRRRLAAEVERLSTILDRPLSLSLTEAAP